MTSNDQGARAKTSQFKIPQVILIVRSRTLTKMAASFLRAGSTFPRLEG